MAQTVPELVGHRGYPARFPENSLPGIEAALQAGARYVEFDVQLTADGVPVLVHDVDLERVADDPSVVTTRSLEELRAMPMGEPARFGLRFRQLRIATLEEAIRLVAGYPDARALVELKQESLDAFGVGPVVEAVVPRLHARHVCIADSRLAIESVRRCSSGPIGWIIHAWREDIRDAAETLRPDFLICNHRHIPADAELWPGPWQWVLYETSEPETALALARRGANLVESDSVVDMLAALGHRSTGGEASDG